MVRNVSGYIFGLTRYFVVTKKKLKLRSHLMHLKQHLAKVRIDHQLLCKYTIHGLHEG